MGITDGIKNIFGNQQQEMPVYPPGNPEYAPMYGAWEAEDLTGTVGVALDNSSLLIQIQSFLSGTQLIEKTDPKTGNKVTVWEQIAEPKMNKKGINSILLELRARLDKNTIMTFIPNFDEVNKFMLHFSTNLVLFLGENIEDFEIRDGSLSQISDFIVDQVYITLLRGLQGNEKQGVYKQFKRIENAQMPLNDPRSMQALKNPGVFK